MQVHALAQDKGATKNATVAKATHDHIIKINNITLYKINNRYKNNLMVKSRCVHFDRGVKAQAATIQYMNLETSFSPPPSSPSKLNFCITTCCAKSA